MLAVPHYIGILSTPRFHPQTVRITITRKFRPAQDKLPTAEFLNTGASNQRQKVKVVRNALTRALDTPSAVPVSNMAASERMQGDGLTAILGDRFTLANARTKKDAQACAQWCMHHR